MTNQKQNQIYNIKTLPLDAIGLVLIMACGAENVATACLCALRGQWGAVMLCCVLGSVLAGIGRLRSMP